MQILTAPHPMLALECRRDFTVTFDQIQEMFALMREHNGMGLAAPQVGIDARLFVTDWNQVFVNPEIVEHSESVSFMREGCLSMPGEFWTLGRWKWIKLSSRERFEGIQARCIQHELDHLDGVMFGGNVRGDGSDP